MKKFSINSDFYDNFQKLIHKLINKSLCANENDILNVSIIPTKEISTFFISIQFPKNQNLII